MSFQSLPQETLLAIAQYVGINALLASNRNLLTLFKTWHTVCCSVIYAQLSLDNRALSNLLMQSDGLKKAVANIATSLKLELTAYHAANGSQHSFAPNLIQYYLMQDRLLANAASYLQTFTKLTSFHIKAANEHKTMSRAHEYDQRLRFHLFAPVLTNLRPQTLSILKLDFVTAFAKDTWRLAPHKCLCTIIVDILPYALHLQIRLRKICPNLFATAVARHGKDWKLQRLDLNVSLKGPIRQLWGYKLSPNHPKRTIHCRDGLKSQNIPDLVRRRLSDLQKDVDSLVCVRVIDHTDGIDYSPVSTDMASGKRFEVAYEDWTHEIRELEDEE